MLPEHSMVISGPCSAETRAQVLETARGLSDMKLEYFRAGIWKPRTRPGEFEGIGDVGIDWLCEVRDTYGLKIATEVAKAEHVELALKKNLDMIWIGARSTVNPFTVQEIAESLKGTNIKVMVKNPVNPDLKLWVGAIERIMKAGITDVSAIHRGFSVYEKTLYRNDPNWQIPIDLKQELPSLPLICDPSHIGGRAHLLLPLAQKAMDLNYDGLMIESHCHPTHAWTDAKQQITPEELKQLLRSLTIRNRSEIAEDAMLDLRDQINQTDEALIQLLTTRMRISEQIGAFKKDKNHVILQSNRWEEALKRNVQKGSESGLSVDFVSQLFKLIHQDSIRIQSEILSKNEDDSAI
ncbi:MAG: chorismate mutase [Flavobacteriales bacterium]